MGLKIFIYRVFKIKPEKVLFQYLHKNHKTLKTVVICNSSQQLSDLDRSLWSVYMDGFLPHHISGEQGLKHLSNITLTCQYEDMANFHEAVTLCSSSEEANTALKVFNNSVNNSSIKKLTIIAHARAAGDSFDSLKSIIETSALLETSDKATVFSDANGGKWEEELL